VGVQHVARIQRLSQIRGLAGAVPARIPLHQRLYLTLGAARPYAAGRRRDESRPCKLKSLRHDSGALLFPRDAPPETRAF